MTEYYFIGKVLSPISASRDARSVSKKGFTKERYWKIRDTNTEKEIKCLINFFCPLDVGDSIAIDSYSIAEDGTYVLTGLPITIIGKDEDTISTFIMKMFYTSKMRSESFKIYKSLCEEASILKKPKSEHVNYVNEVCCRWADASPARREIMIRNRFKNFDQGTVKLFLRTWYKKRILRQYYVFGFTLTEIKTIREFHSNTKNICEIFKEFIVNPYIFFTIEPKKINLIAEKLGKDTEENKKIYSLLRNIYLKFLSGGNGYCVEDFCRSGNDKGNEKGNDKGNEEREMSLIEPWTREFKGYIYFLSVFEKEKEIAERLQKISHIKTCYEVEEDQIENLSSDQKDAISGMLKSPIAIISGPAGSGKTTILKRIVDVIEGYGEKVVIASFTGKAVARIKKVLDRQDPQTLHMLLKKPVDFDVLIIDEASMVSSSLFHQVLTTFDHYFRLYLIGDVSQLPPIEWGRPFYDLMKTKKIPTFFLTKCHRFYEEDGEINGILENANGMIKKKDWSWVERNNFKILKNCSIDKVVKTVINSKISMNQFTIICPYNKPLNEINQKCSKMFLPESISFTDSTGKIWRIGDRVVNLKNNYELNIMNGDEGFITEFTQSGIKVKFGSQETEFLFSSSTLDDIEENEDEDLNEVEKTPMTTKQLNQSYAMTIHKSQGSEWDFVLLYLPNNSPSGFMTKNLFYTAITRARQCLWIITENTDLLQKINSYSSEFGNDALSIIFEN